MYDVHSDLKLVQILLFYIISVMVNLYACLKFLNKLFVQSCHEINLN